MEIAIEILREAGIRLPKPLGPAMGIVGGLIIGDRRTSRYCQSVSRYCRGRNRHLFLHDPGLQCRNYTARSSVFRDVLCGSAWTVWRRDVLPSSLQSFGHTEELRRTLCKSNGALRHQ